jgi:hypothetical protein
MKIYTRRNALVGYLVLRTRKRAINKKLRRRRSGMKLVAYVGLGLVSAGILAAVLAIAVRRRALEAAGIDAGPPEDELEIVGEYVTAPEPAPAA